MSAFRFSLEPVLKQREAIEHDAQQEVASRERTRLAILHELQTLQERDDAERRDLANRLGSTGRLDASALRQQSVATMQVARQIREAALLASGATHRLDQARTVLIEATARRRAIELVREQQYEEWKARERRRETESLDEMSMAMRRIKAIGQDERAEHGGAA